MRKDLELKRGHKPEAARQDSIPQIVLTPDLYLAG
jgi:hypothetical protein